MSKLNIKHNFISQNQNTKTIERVFWIYLNVYLLLKKFFTNNKRSTLAHNPKQTSYKIQKRDITHMYFV